MNQRAYLQIGGYDGQYKSADVDKQVKPAIYCR